MEFTYSISFQSCFLLEILSLEDGWWLEKKGAMDGHRAVLSFVFITTSRARDNKSITATAAACEHNKRHFPLSTIVSTFYDRREQTSYVASFQERNHWLRCIVQRCTQEIGSSSIASLASIAIAHWSHWRHVLGVNLLNKYGF